jgi:uncharacterized protein (TIGR02678 family)
MLKLASTEIVEMERSRALRALLRRPLLPSSGDTAEEYLLVRRHSVWLKQWLTTFPAWSLHISTELARLHKTPPDVLDDTRSAVDQPSGTAFNRRRYVFLCLGLAALEASDRQITLGEITRTILELVATDPELLESGVVLNLANYDQRRDLMHAVRLLLEMGVLRKLDGDERPFLDHHNTADVLYDIDRSVLSAVLIASGSTGEPLSEPIRARLVRALLDDPVLYFHDLTAEERTYLEEHRGYLLRQIQEATGLVAEIRAEGIAMVDPAGDLTDINLPDESPDARLSLLLAHWFAASARAAAGTTIPLPAVEAYVQGEAHRTGAQAWLMDALWRLRALRLVELTPGGVVPLPACARYASE